MPLFTKLDLADDGESAVGFVSGDGDLLASLDAATQHVAVLALPDDRRAVLLLKEPFRIRA